MADQDVKTLMLQIDANVELLRKRIPEGNAALDRFERDAQRTLDRFDGRMARVGEGGFTGLDRAAAAARATIGGLLAGVSIAGAAALGREFVGLADQASSMRAQLKLATADMGSFAQAQADVARLSADTRGGLEATTALYGTFVRNSASLGRGQDDAARATETFAKALKLGGAGAAEASSATLQFSQALASGVLRGDEFNSIAEASPRIMRLLADSLGVSTGALRGMAAEGELSADKLYSALTDRRFTAQIDREFKTLPATFDESMTLVRDAAVTTFGAFDQGGQLSTAIASFVAGSAADFGTMAKDAEQLGIDIRGTFAGLSNALEPFLDGGRAIFELLRGDAHAFVLATRDDIRQVLGLLDQVTAATGGKLLARALGQQPIDFVKRFDSASSRYDRLRRAELDEQAVQGIFGTGFTVRSSEGTGRLTAPAPAAKKARTRPGGSKAKGKPDPSPTERRDKATFETGVGLDVADPGALVDVAERARTSIAAMAADIAAVPTLDILSVDEVARIDAARGAVEEFSRSLGEDLVTAQARGLGSLEEGLSDAITGAQSLGDAFGRVADQIIADLVRIAIRQAIIKPLAGALFGGAGAGGGILSSLFGGGRATGGSIDPSKFYVVGERGPELFAPGKSGTIIPNHRLTAPKVGAIGGAGGAQRVQVDTTVRVAPSRDFMADVDTRVAQGVGAMAPAVAQRAANGVMDALTRPTLPGSMG